MDKTCDTFAIDGTKQYINLKTNISYETNEKGEKCCHGYIIDIKKENIIIGAIANLRGAILKTEDGEEFKIIYGERSMSKNVIKDTFLDSGVPFISYNSDNVNEFLNNNITNN